MAHCFPNLRVYTSNFFLPKKLHFQHILPCPTPPTPPHPTPPTPPHPTPPHPTPPHPIPSHPIPSHPIPSHPIPSHPIPSHPILSGPVKSSKGVTLCRIVNLIFENRLIFENCQSHFLKSSISFLRIVNLIFENRFRQVHASAFGLSLLFARFTIWPAAKSSMCVTWIVNLIFENRQSHFWESFPPGSRLGLRPRSLIRQVHDLACGQVLYGRYVNRQSHFWESSISFLRIVSARFTPRPSASVSYSPGSQLGLRPRPLRALRDVTWRDVTSHTAITNSLRE